MLSTRVTPPQSGRDERLFLAHKRRKRCVMTKRGVTVWELLAVLVIIAVVAAILFPVFFKARECARCGDSCLSQTKQLGLAFMQYKDNYDGALPNISDTPGSKTTWRVMIYSQIKSHDIYRCPEDKSPLAPDGFAPSYAANYSGTYNGGPLDKGNGAFAGPGSYPLSLNKFPDPGHLIVLCEVDHSNAPEFNIDDPVRFGPSKHILSVRHSDGSNYLLADGHSKWFYPKNTVGLWYRDPQRPLSANAQAILLSGHD